MRAGGSASASSRAGRGAPKRPRCGRTIGMRVRGMLADRLTDQSICPALENDHRMRAAAIQMNSTGDRAGNRATADRLVRAAASSGTALVVLPEKWNVLGTPEQLAAGAEPLDGPTIEWARAIARELSIDLIAGSIV